MAAPVATGDATCRILKFKNGRQRALARARRNRSRAMACSSNATRSAAATKPWVGSTQAVGQRVIPLVRILAGERAVEKRMHALVDLLTQLGNLRLADPSQSHRLHQIVDPPGRHATDPRLLDYRDQRLLRAL